MRAASGSLARIFCEQAMMPRRLAAPGENHAGQREGDRMVDDTRSKLVCATVVAIGLLFAMIYANQRIPGGDAAVTVSVAR